MPWFADPLDFLTDVDQIRRQSRSLDWLADDGEYARMFRVARGGAGPVEAPWLDVDKAVLIAVCRYAGDDTAVALDYRTSIDDPRVVASDLWSGPQPYGWRTVAETFTAFTAALGLVGRYSYVGPAEILQQVQPGRRGQAVTSQHELATWLAQQPAREREEPFTFVIDLAGTLRLAPQRSEHVVCAGGEPVLGAGEIAFVRERDRWVVGEISNQSTGYCPDVSSWEAVAAALDRAGIDHPAAFSRPIIFRRCTKCRQRNIVKDGYYVCAVCDAALPGAWNIDEAGG